MTEQTKPTLARFTPTEGEKIILRDLVGKAVTELGNVQNSATSIKELAPIVRQYEIMSKLHDKLVAATPPAEEPEEEEVAQENTYQAA